MPAGSVRLKVYDIAIKRARKAGKLPHDAKEVYDALIVKLRSVIRETKMQKQERVEKEFHDLTMGRLPHATFRTEWEYLIDEMEEAGVDMPTEGTLFRRYLGKITPEVRSLVLSGNFALDGPGSSLRKPKTWEEVAECIELELESRADARAPTEHVHSFGPPSGPARITCAHCRRHDHHTEYCPKQAAERRGESTKCLADHERSGRICSICGQGDHNEEHHRQAIADYMARMGAPPAAAVATTPTQPQAAKAQPTTAPGRGNQAGGKGARKGFSPEQKELPIMQGAFHQKMAKEK